MSKPRHKRSRAGRPDLWSLARHDFRQPAQSLELLASTIARASDAATRGDCAIKIRQIAASLREMSEGLTLISRVEAGELPAIPASLRLAGVLESACRGFENGALDIAADVAGLTVLADPALFSAAVGGMVCYAAKYADNGPVVISVRSPKSGLAKTDLTKSDLTKTSLTIDVAFGGTHPRTAATTLAFIELEPPDRHAMPSLGLGPALLRRLAGAVGWQFDLSSSESGMALISLSVPVPPDA